MSVCCLTCNKRSVLNLPIRLLHSARNNTICWWNVQRESVSKFKLVLLPPKADYEETKLVILVPLRLTNTSVWLKWHLSLAHLTDMLRCVRIWGIPITGHMWVTLCTIQWKWRLWDYESVTKLLCMLQAIQLDKKGHNRIYDIIIYPWHEVTRNVTCSRVFSDLPRCNMSVKGSKWEMSF